MELKRYLQIVWKWRWLIALCTLLAAGVSYGVSSIVPSVYRASTSLLVSVGGVLANDYTSLLANQQLAATYTELLVKRPVIEAAAMELGLDPRRVEKKVKVRLIPNTTVIELTVEYDDPRLAMEIANGIVAAFRQTFRESGGARSREVVVVEPAIQPLEPVAPRKFFYTAVAAIVGAGLAVGAAFLIEYLNDTLENADQVREALSLPSLGMIPFVKSWQRDGPARVKEGEWLSLEAFRILCTNIQFANVDSPVRTLLVTSAGPGEGKTGVIANLSTVMAQNGRKVLLVDTDFRRPSLHRVFDLRNPIGLTSMLLGNASREECVIETNIPNLYVLPSGPRPPNPSELLGSQRMAHLIEEFRSFGDIILFDVPPVLVGADAIVLASQVDGVVLVVDSRSTRREAAKQTLEMLRSAKAKVLGVVLNKASTGSSKYYYSDDGKSPRSLSNKVTQPGRRSQNIV